MTSVVNLSGRKSRRLEDDEVYVGRPAYWGGWSLTGSVFANRFSERAKASELKGERSEPFTVGEDGDRDECVRLFRKDVEKYRNEPRFIEDLLALKGKKLACSLRSQRFATCWCINATEITPLKCHAQVLLELIRELDQPSEIHVYSGEPSRYDSSNDYDAVRVLTKGSGTETGMIDPSELDADVKVYLLNKRKECETYDKILPVLSSLSFVYRDAFHVKQTLQQVIDHIRNDPAYKRAVKDSRGRASVKPKVFRVDDQVVEFYGKDSVTSSGRPGYGKHLSNCVKVTNLDIGGRNYPSTEHYYQVYKYRYHSGDNVPEAVKAEAMKKVERMMSLTPVGVALEGRKRDLPIRSDWEQMKVMVMYRALVAKFSLPKFKEALFSTGDAVLIERAPRDSSVASLQRSGMPDLWTVNDRGEGENMLGVLLMITREFVR